jgi:hypothetical protein
MEPQISFLPLNRPNAMKNFPLVIAVASLTPLFWLGASFTIKAEADPLYQASWSVESIEAGPFVHATHPDSHRLGLLQKESGTKVPLPSPRTDGPPVQSSILDLALPGPLPALGD